MPTLSANLIDWLNGSTYAPGHPIVQDDWRRELALGDLLEITVNLDGTDSGKGSDTVGVVDDHSVFTGDTLSDVLYELYQAAVSGGSDTFTDTNAYYPTDTIGAALVALGVAIGGTTTVARNYTSNLVVADNDTLLVAVSKLDSEAGSYQNLIAVATIAVANAGGGAVAAALTVDLFRGNAAATPISAVSEIMIVTRALQYQPGQALNANCTFGAATKGSIVDSGNGWCLALTNATGEFDCTVTNAVDETVWFAVQSPVGSSAPIADRLSVMSSNADSAVWSA